MTKAAWQISRFDLVYYNPRYKRWQFFADDPADPNPITTYPQEGLHRYLIRSLLRTFREAVRASITTCRLSSFAVQNRHAKGSKLKIPQPQTGTRQYSTWKKYKTLYLESLINTAWHDGVPHEHRRTLQDWFNNGSTKISREHALTILTLLPILEDWDTWGCFIRARKGDKKDKHCFPPADAKSWAEPLYVVELKFKDKPDREANQFRSRQLLGYQVTIEGLCLDLAQASPTIHTAPAADFFDERFCKNPVNDEETLYRLYATLFDAIIQRLSPTGAKRERQFIIAYPLTAAGRLHFVQIGLFPPPRAHSCVDCLWKDWQPIHSNLWTPYFRDFLQEEMHRIITAAFQSEVFSYLAESIKNNGICPDMSACQQQLAAHIHHLLPARCACSDAGQKYSYSQYHFAKSDSQLYVGYRWQRHRVSCGKDICTNIGYLHIRSELQPSDELAKIVRDHRIRQAASQQREFLSWLPEGLKGAEREAILSRQKAHAIVLQYARSIESSQVSRDILAKEPEIPYAWSLAKEPYLARYAPRSLKRFIAEAFNLREEDDDKFLSCLRSAMRPSILLELSEFFETGPGRMISHTTPEKYWDGNDVKGIRNAANTHLFKLADTLLTRIRGEEVLKQAAGERLKKFEKLIDMLKYIDKKAETIADYGPPRNVHDTSNRGKASRIAHELRLQEGPTIEVLGTEINVQQSALRFYVIDAMKILDPFMQCLCRKNMGTGYYVRFLRSYAEATPPRYAKCNGDTQFPNVRRVDHYIVIPLLKGFKMNGGPEAIAEGEPGISWASNKCGLVAELHIHSKKRTIAILPSCDLQQCVSEVDHQAHARFSKDRVRRDHKAVLTVSFSTWRTVEQAQYDVWKELYSVNITSRGH